MPTRTAEGKAQTAYTSHHKDQNSPPKFDFKTPLEVIKPSPPCMEAVGIN